MEYWTVLWITILSGPLDGTSSGLIYKSLEQCQASMNLVTHNLDYDYTVMCDETLTPSYSVRPRPRPEHLEGAW